MSKKRYYVYIEEIVSNTIQVEAVSPKEARKEAILAMVGPSFWTVNIRATKTFETKEVREGGIPILDQKPGKLVWRKKNK